MALVLNASRRFRYTLDLKREIQKEELRTKIRANIQVVRVYFSRKPCNINHLVKISESYL